jgi:hypothetical protein
MTDLQMRLDGVALLLFGLFTVSSVRGHPSKQERRTTAQGERIAAGLALVRGVARHSRPPASVVTPDGFPTGFSPRFLPGKLHQMPNGVSTPASGDMVGAASAPRRERDQQGRK